VRPWLIVIAATGCGSLYQAGSLDGPIYQLGCVDVAVRGAWPHEAVGPVVVIALGNRCEHSVAIDLRRLEVFHDGTRLAAYDPDDEIDARRIDARISGEEWIEYRALSRIDGLDALDVDIGRVVDANANRHVVRIAVPRREAP
jgi:hypothetical protein